MRPTAWTRRQRAWLGAATFWPVVYVAVFLLLPPTRLWFVARGWHMAGGLTGSMIAGMALHSATLVETGLLVVTYAIHLASTDRVPEEQKLPWTLLLLVANVLVMPFYWYLYVWSIPRSAQLRPPRD